MRDEVNEAIFPHNGCCSHYTAGQADVSLEAMTRMLPLGHMFLYDLMTLRKRLFMTEIIGNEKPSRAGAGPAKLRLNNHRASLSDKQNQTTSSFISCICLPEFSLPLPIVHCALMPSSEDSRDPTLEWVSDLNLSSLRNPESPLTSPSSSPSCKSSAVITLLGKRKRRNNGSEGNQDSAPTKAPTTRLTRQALRTIPGNSSMGKTVSILSIEH